MPFQLRQLRHLLALADHGSFGRAATALGMTQPALSRSIKELEHDVGGALFVRTPSGVTPSDEGRLLIQRAREVVHAADELDREVHRRRVPGTEHLAIGAGPYPGETIVPDALARLVAAHPLLRVRVVQRDWDELLRKLRAREIDYFVGELSTLEGEPDLDIETLGEHQVYFVGRCKHPLTRRAGVRAEHTFAYPFVALGRYPPRALRPMLAARREGDPVRRGRPFPAVELGTLAAVKRLVADSDAIAALPLPTLADELERGTLAVLGTEPWMTLRYGFVGLKGRDSGAAAVQLRAFVREAEAKITRDEARLAARVVPEPERRPSATRPAVPANE